MPKPVFSVGVDIVAAETLPGPMRCEKAVRKLRICFIYSRLPFPMQRGDQLTVTHFLAYLAARGHEVDFFALDTGGHMSEGQRRWLHSVCRRVALYPHPLLTRFWGTTTAFFSGKPMQVGYFHNATLAHDVATEINTAAYDVVYAYYLRSADAVPNIFVPNTATTVSGRSCAGFLAMQLSQTLNTQRMAENETHFLKRIVFRLETCWLRRYEARIWRNFTKTVLIGDKDVDAVKAACRYTGEPEIDNWIYGAHGTDVHKFRVAEADEEAPLRVVFSGSMGYAPNIQAADWFLRNCWAAIRAQVPSAELLIVGRDPPSSLRAQDGMNGVRVTGTVPDVGQYIRSAAVCVNPMLAAGGMQNKLIEYMASGKSIVATTVANEGIHAPEDTLCIADTPQDFVQAVLRLLGNPESRLTMGMRARAYVEAEWTWEAHFEKLEKAFIAALKN
jgi:polysaccharide biosynthesis protein PslH